MFGSVPQLAGALDDLLRRRAQCIARHAHDPSLHAPPWFVIVDARGCRGCEFGGAQELCKMEKLVEEQGGTLRIAQPPAHVAAAIEAASQRPYGDFLSFDDELRNAEDRILAQHAPPLPDLNQARLPSTLSSPLPGLEPRPAPHLARSRLRSTGAPRRTFAPASARRSRATTRLSSPHSRSARTRRTSLPA